MATLNEFKSMKINNANVRKHVDAVVNTLPELLKQADSFRELVQLVIRHAILSKAEDTDGEIGCQLINKFMAEVTEKRVVSPNALRDYILFVFSDGPIKNDKKGKPILDEGLSALRYVHKDDKFITAKDKADGETLKDPDGNPYKKGKLISRPINLVAVKTRLKAYSWWDFTPAKPEKPYKGKAVTAIKSDLKKLAEGQYIPEDNMREFLNRVKSLAFDCGISLD